MVAIFRYNLTRTEWDELRLRVKQRDRNQCIFYPVGCVNGRGTDGQGKGLIADHKVPWKTSRDNSMSNLRTLCVRHNAMLGYRETVNPLLTLDQMEEISALGEADRALNRGFGVLRPVG